MASSRRQYPFHLIEPKWQKYWDEQQAFRAFNPGDDIPANHAFAQRHQLSGKVSAAQLPPKYYILDMFPYPSGSGLHVGHPEGYTATDILARYRRALGFNVLHPMGWDSFGLPAEQYAVKTGQHPRKTTEENIANFKRQIKSLGFSYDWSRELATTNVDYFKWTQWIFLKLYNSWFNPETNKAELIETLKYPADCTTEEQKREYRDGKRLAFIAEAPVNWCSELGTVVANEEIVDGKTDVGGFSVVRKPMRQWMLRITAYAEKLLADLDTIEWSDSLKEMQRNWIGRSEGAFVDFQVSGHPEKIRVFTTRPDTLFGATYMVLAPEHPLVELIAPDNSVEWANIEKYRVEIASKSDRDRTELSKEKTGVFTGAYAINPVNGEKIPIWIADYVLATYGTGAIMAVPAHDERDLEFAKKFDLLIVQVVQPPDPKTDWHGFVDDGTSVNSGFITGLPTPEAKKKITAWLEEKGLGKKTINYKLRDWLFSRQRYWGEPFPLIWKRDKDGSIYHEGLPETVLPLLPPELDDFKPTPGDTPRPPLGRAKEWLTLPDGSTRELNTMPQWAGSCWYYLRYLDAKNADAFVGKEAEAYWMGRATGPALQQSAKSGGAETLGVDLYVGGTEHAVLHLLYARFWHKLLFDLGYVSTAEPFFKLVNQGLILGETEFTQFALANGELVSTAKVKDIEEEATKDTLQLVGVHEDTGEKVFGTRVPADAVEIAPGGYVLENQPEIRVDARSFKMSKSRKNVVNPDDMIAEFGADALRLYEMFMGPLQDTKPWNTKGVEGVYRFLGRVWRLFVDEKSETEFEQVETTAEAQKRDELLDLIKLSPAIKDAEATPAQLKTLHACIKKVTEDLDGMRFNTAISAMMVFVNEAMTWETKPVSVLKTFLQLLQPFAPHLAEELWEKLHATRTDIRNLAYEPWPKFDPALLVESEIEIPVQVNGKVRDVIRVPVAADNATLEAAAKASEKAKPFIEGKTIKKIIVVPKKLVNIVVA